MRINSGTIFIKKKIPKNKNLKFLYDHFKSQIKNN